LHIQADNYSNIKNNTPFIGEKAAIVWGMEHFCTYLRGRTFTVYSERKSLEAQSKRHKRHKADCKKPILDAILTLCIKRI
jgi:hypothetical protein